MTEGYEGGTWLGITTQGKFSCLTNIRGDMSKSDQMKQTKKGRGALISNFLKNDIDATEYFMNLQEEKFLYSPFNMISGDVNGDLFYINNVDDSPALLNAGW